MFHMVGDDVRACHHDRMGAKTIECACCYMSYCTKYTIYARMV